MRVTPLPGSSFILVHLDVTTLSRLMVELTRSPTVHHGKFFTTPPTPYFCLGFLFDSKIAYLSDVSFVPEAVWDLIAAECTLPSDDDSPLPPDESGPTALTNGIDALHLDAPATKTKQRLAALIIDCLRLEQHMSHFGFPQAVSTARRSGAKKTYLVSPNMSRIAKFRRIDR